MAAAVAHQFAISPTDGCGCALGRGSAAPYVTSGSLKVARLAHHAKSAVVLPKWLRRAELNNARRKQKTPTTLLLLGSDLVVRFPVTTNPHSVLMRGQWLSFRFMRGSWRLVVTTLIYAHASVFPRQPSSVIRLNTRTPNRRRSSSSLPTSLTVGVCDG